MSTSEKSQLPTNISKESSIGVLLIHGLNGHKEDMAEMETFLQEKGMITVNMLLPGHGVPVSEMASLGWEDWADAVRYELNLLKQRCDYVFPVGHSLGGALALHVITHTEVTGIVTMCAPLHMYPGSKQLVGVIRRITPFLPRLHEDVKDPEVRRRYKRNIYRWSPVAPVYSMLQFLPQLRAEIPQITVPALIMTALNDHVVPARDGREIYRLLGSREKYLITYHHSYHMIMNARRFLPGQPLLFSITQIDCFTSPGEDTELADHICQFCIFTKKTQKSCLNKLALSCYNEMHNGIMKVASWLPNYTGASNGEGYSTTKTTCWGTKPEYYSDRRHHCLTK